MPSIETKIQTIESNLQSLEVLSRYIHREDIVGYDYSSVNAQIEKLMYCSAYNISNVVSIPNKIEWSCMYWQKANGVKKQRNSVNINFALIPQINIAWLHESLIKPKEKYKIYVHWDGGVTWNYSFLLKDKEIISGQWNSSAYSINNAISWGDPMFTQGLLPFIQEEHGQQIQQAWVLKGSIACHNSNFEPEYVAWKVFESLWGNNILTRPKKHEQYSVFYAEQLTKTSLRTLATAVATKVLCNNIEMAVDQDYLYELYGFICDRIACHYNGVVSVNHIKLAVKDAIIKYKLTNEIEHASSLDNIDNTLVQSLTPLCAVYKTLRLYVSDALQLKVKYSYEMHKLIADCRGVYNASALFTKATSLNRQYANLGYLGINGEVLYYGDGSPYFVTELLAIDKIFLSAYMAYWVINNRTNDRSASLADKDFLWQLDQIFSQKDSFSQQMIWLDQILKQRGYGLSSEIKQDLLLNYAALNQTQELTKCKINSLSVPCKPLLMLLGDSIAVGIRANNPVDEYLSRKYKDNYDLINIAAAGKTSFELLQELPAILEKTRGYTVAAAIISIGANNVLLDANCHVVDADESVNILFADLQSIITLINGHHPNAKVLLSYAVPQLWQENYADSNIITRHLQAINIDDDNSECSQWQNDDKVFWFAPDAALLSKENCKNRKTLAVHDASVEDKIHPRDVSALHNSLDSVLQNILPSSLDSSHVFEATDRANERSLLFSQSCSSIGSNSSQKDTGSRTGLPELSPP